MIERCYLAVYEVKQYERIASYGKAADFGDAKGGCDTFHYCAVISAQDDSRALSAAKRKITNISKNHRFVRMRGSFADLWPTVDVTLVKLIEAGVANKIFDSSDVKIILTDKARKIPVK